MNTNPNPTDEGPEDPAIDSLLRELLGEDTPPNFVPKAGEIHRVTRMTGNPVLRFTEEDRLAAVHGAQNDIRVAPSSRRSPSRLHRPPTGGIHRYAPWGALALAASMVAILASYPWWRSREAGKPIVRNIDRKLERSDFPPMGSGSDDLFQGNSPSVTKEPDEPQRSPAAHSKTDRHPPDPPPSVERNPEVLVPQVVQSWTTESNDDRPVRVSASDQQVIAVIDQQLSHMWNRWTISPNPKRDLGALEDRLCQALIGRLPTDAERAWGRQATVATGPMESAKALACRWIVSEEFDRYWARSLSDYFLDHSMGLEDSMQAGDKKSWADFEAWLQESIRRNAPVGAMESRLIASDIRGEDPASFWVKRWIAVGKKSGGILLESDGKSPAGRGVEQWKALDTLALQSARLSGRSVFPIEHIAYPSLSSEYLVGNAAAWVFVFAPEKPQSSEKWRDLYVADSEGKVILVTPIFPDGKPFPPSDDPRSALAQWFQESVEARGAIVNYLWARLLGQPLVPEIGLTDAEGLEDRKDLLEFLATEAQSQRASLRQIASWIALASPLYSEDETMEAKDFLEFEPSRLASIQRQTRLFAIYSGAMPTTAIGQRFKDLSEWLKPTEAGAASVLAQPATDRRPEGKRATSNSSQPAVPLPWPPERIRHELLTLHPFARVHEVSVELANSSLAWEAIVERVFLVCLSRYPQASERNQAAQLLMWSNGDRQAASIRLLNILAGSL